MGTCTRCRLSPPPAPLRVSGPEEMVALRRRVMKHSECIRWDCDLPMDHAQDVPLESACLIPCRTGSRWMPWEARSHAAIRRGWSSPELIRRTPQHMNTVISFELNAFVFATVPTVQKAEHGCLKVCLRYFTRHTETGAQDSRGYSVWSLAALVGDLAEVHGQDHSHWQRKASAHWGVVSFLCGGDCRSWSQRGRQESHLLGAGSLTLLTCVLADCLCSPGAVWSVLPSLRNGVGLFDELKFFDVEQLVSIGMS